MLASKACFQPGPDAPGQRSLRDEVVLIAWMDDRAAAVFYPKGRDQEVEVGMVQHPAGPGMKHGDLARLCTEVTRVSAEFF